MHPKVQELIEIVGRTRVDHTYSQRPEEFLDERIAWLAAKCPRVLDFGRSSRHRFQLFAPGQAVTADINQYEGYPDLICDLCDRDSMPQERFDGIVCLSILEHTYNPLTASENLHFLLKDGGVCLGYAPFLYRYHSFSSEVEQDFYRFSHDGLAYMLRDFREVTLYSVRGPNSTMLNLFKWWKRKVEKKYGFRLNRFLDRLNRSPERLYQTSGYYFWAVK